MYTGFSLQGKNALITGGSRGIGLAIARGFLDSGAHVTICSRKQDGLEQALRELSDQAERVRAVQAHIGQADDVSRLVETAEAAFGRIHILVNNAGTNPYFGPVIESEDWAWDKTMDVNLKGPYRLCRAVGRKMQSDGSGSIINIASIA